MTLRYGASLLSSVLLFQTLHIAPRTAPNPIYGFFKAMDCIDRVNVPGASV